MSQETTMTQVMERLQTLEEMVKLLSMQITTVTSSVNFEFVIRIDGQDVWQGVDLVTHYPKIRQQNPQATVSIGWQSSPVVLI